MNYSELLQLARFGVIFCDYQRIIIWRLLWNYKNVCNGFSVFCSPDQEGIYAPEEIRKPVAFFSKMEMQLSPFLSATFGTFIMQETAEAETDVSLYPSGLPYLTFYTRFKKLAQPLFHGQGDVYRVPIMEHLHPIEATCGLIIMSGTVKGLL